MVDFREMIRREMKRQGMSAYALAKAAGLPIRGVQAFISATNDASSERLALMLDALGLDLIPKRRRRSASKRGKR